MFQDEKSTEKNLNEIFFATNEEQPFCAKLQYLKIKIETLYIQGTVWGETFFVY